MAIYLLRLADVLGVDLSSAIREKIAHNAEKYPVSKAKGSAAKYDEHEQTSLLRLSFSQPVAQKLGATSKPRLALLPT